MSSSSHRFSSSPLSSLQLSTKVRGGGGAGVAYHDPTYWQTRFISDPREQNGFEWLSSSSSSSNTTTTDSSSLLKDHIPTCLLLRNPPPRILHIGVGTSKLSLDLVRYWYRHCRQDWKERAKGVVNVDFALASIDFQKRIEREFLNELEEAKDDELLMEYRVLDLLNWRQVKKDLGQMDGFDLVLDKSTTDSISTGDDIPYSSICSLPRYDLNKIYNKNVVQIAQSEARNHGKNNHHHGAIATVQVLGIHLGMVVKRDGGMWLCHSYSSNRWDDVKFHNLGLEQPNESSHHSLAWPWNQVKKIPIPTQSSDPNSPLIHHYIYTLHRT